MILSQPWVTTFQSEEIKEGNNLVHSTLTSSHQKEIKYFFLICAREKFLGLRVYACRETSTA